MRAAVPKGPANMPARVSDKWMANEWQMIRFARMSRARSNVLISGGAREQPRAPFSGGRLPGAHDGNTSVHIAKERYQLARYEYAPRHVVEARYLHDYKVWLEFNDGRKGVVDLADELYGDEHTPLRDRDTFSRFYLDYGLASIAWLDGADFAPEFLYERLKAMN